MKPLVLNNIQRIKKKDIETQAYNFIKRLSLQLIQRLLINLKFFQQLKFLSYEICLSQNRSKFQDLLFLKEITKPNNLGILKSQWNRLLGALTGLKSSEKIY